MTGVRQSFCFALEKKFGKGKPADSSWTAVPPGTFIQTTAQRDVTRINTSGMRLPARFAYNRFGGKWDWSFALDYNYLEPLLLIFDYYTCTGYARPLGTTDVTIGEGESAVIFKVGEWTKVPSGHTKDDKNLEYVYEHEFKLKDNNRTPSFTLRRVILHGIAGNEDEYPDEIGIIKGCVCTSFRMSQAAGSSMMQCAMTGFYVNEEIHRVAVYGTDYHKYDNGDGLLEYFCMFMDALKDDYYVANTESIGLDVANSVSPVTNSCGPISRQFTMGYAQIQFSTSCYANDPKRYKERMFRGGRSSGDKGEDPYKSQFYERNVDGSSKTPEVKDGYKSGTSYKKDVFDTTLSTTGFGKATAGYMLMPACKELAPLEDAYMVSYNLCREWTDDGDTQTGSLTTAINKSDKMFKIHLTNVTMTSATWQKGDGSKLYDQLSSTECGNAELTVRNHSSAYAEVSTVHCTATKFNLHKVTKLAEEINS